MTLEKCHSLIKFTQEVKGSTYGTCLPTKIELTIAGDSDITECIEAFENFLLGCGYRLGENEKIGIMDVNE